jgi:hypothetical protein
VQRSQCRGRSTVGLRRSKIVRILGSDDTGSDPAHEQGELEEDLVLVRRKFPELEGMPESQKPTSWYPGWRRVERMKQTWAAADRKRSVSLPDAQQDVVSNWYAVTGP